MKPPAIKRAFLNLNMMDYQTMTDFFEKMAAQGWMLHELGQVTVRFKKSEPADLKFDIGICPEENLVDPWVQPKNRENWDDFDRIQQSGLQFVCSRQKLHIFCADAGNDPPPIHVDRMEKEKLIHKITWKSTVVICILFCFCIFLCAAGMQHILQPLLTIRRIFYLLLFGYLLLFLVFGGNYLYRHARAGRYIKHGILPPQSTIRAARVRSLAFCYSSAVLYLIAVGINLTEAIVSGDVIQLCLLALSLLLIGSGFLLHRWIDFKESSFVNILLMIGISLPFYLV